MDLTSIIDKLREFDINDLDMNNVGIWPTPIKVIAGLLLFGLVIAGGYWFYYQDMQKQYETLQKKELSLKSSYEVKAVKAANLDAYKKQMDEMEASFGALLEQLPKDTEVPGLLEDITRTGNGAGRGGNFCGGRAQGRADQGDTADRTRGANVQHVGAHRCRAGS